MGSIMDQERPWKRKEEAEQEDASKTSGPLTEMLFPKKEVPIRPRFEALRKRLGLPPK